MLDYLLSWVATLWGWFTSATWHMIKENPYLVWLAVYAFARATAATVDTGQTGLLFSFGRARQVLQPGFKWLIPFLQVVRIVPTRARTLDLPAQRVTTADGLVVDVDANVVYRIVDVRKALIEIDELEKGMAQVLGLCVQRVLRTFERAQLRVSEELDRQLVEAMQPMLDPWGVTVERAGCSTIKPSPETLVVVQLEALSRERETQLQRFLDAGIPRGLALPLSGNAPRVQRRAVRAAEREREAGRRRKLRRTIRRIGREHGILAAGPLLALEQAGRQVVEGRREEQDRRKQFKDRKGSKSKSSKDRKDRKFVSVSVKSKRDDEARKQAEAKEKRRQQLRDSKKRVTPRAVSPRWLHKHRDVHILAGKQASNV